MIRKTRKPHLSWLPNTNNVPTGTENIKAFYDENQVRVPRQSLTELFSYNKASGLW